MSNYSTWKTKSFSQCVEKIIDHRGKTPKKLGLEWGNGNILALSANNVKNGKIDTSIEAYYGSEELYERWMTKGKVNKGDIIMTMEAPLGNVTQIPDNKKYILSQRVAAFKTIEDIDNDYFKYYLTSNKFQNLLYRFSTGTTAKGISQKNLRPLPVSYPSIKEQQKIATILSSVDEAIKKTEEIINQIQNVKKGLMHQLLTRGIGKNEYKNTIIGVIPDNWEVKSLGEMIEENIIISHLDGNHGSLYPRADEFVQEGIPYISANSLNNGKVEFKNAKYLSLERANKIKKGIAKDKDVLFAHNATVGPVAVLETDLEFVILSTTLTYYRCNKELINPYYLSYYLQSSKFVNQYSRVMAQSTRNQVPITTQRKFQHVIPPLDEQNVIVEIMESIDSKLLNENNKLVELRNIKQGLMQQLLTGKVRVSINEEVPQ